MSTFEGSQRKELTTFYSFENFWKEKYPNLKIRAISEDIFSEFQFVAIRYKYRTFREITIDGSVSFSPDYAELFNVIRANSNADEGEE